MPHLAVSLLFLIVIFSITGIYGSAMHIIMSSYVLLHITSIRRCGTFLGLPSNLHCKECSIRVIHKVQQGM